MTQDLHVLAQISCAHVVRIRARLDHQCYLASHIISRHRRARQNDTRHKCRGHAFVPVRSSHIVHVKLRWAARVQWKLVYMLYSKKEYRRNIRSTCSAHNLVEAEIVSNAQIQTTESNVA